MFSADRVGGTPRVPEELLESAKSQEFVRVCKEFGAPCPLRAGDGGLCVTPPGAPQTLCKKDMGVRTDAGLINKQK